jgi:hypothetical protein
MYQTRQNYVVQFTDHTEQEALIVFDGKVSCPLLPLVSFALYFTNLDVTLILSGQLKF